MVIMSHIVNLCCTTCNTYIKLRNASMTYIIQFSLLKKKLWYIVKILQK